jgi:hypothetical protein
MSQLFFKKELFYDFNPETKTYKLFNALYNGEAVSASQAQKRFGIKNISLKSAVFAKQVMQFMPTAAKQATASKSQSIVIGKPSRKLVAAGYKAMALGLV